MVLCGIAAFHPVVDGCDSRRLRWTSLLGEPSPPRFLIGSPALRGWRARCSSGKIASGPESRGTAGRTGGSSATVEHTAPSEEEEEEEELGPGIKFEMSDVAVSDQVSVGLQGRVLKKLTRRRIMYHSYAMQVHGYVSSSDSEDDSFTLVHGLSDWLPTLEATLALDEEYVRRVGDDTVGGPAVTRQLRLTRILMRDLLIGVNYLHSHGLAHTELRLENVHISPVDKHVKVGILGNAVDFFDNSSSDSMVEGNTDRRRLMIAFDMRYESKYFGLMGYKDLWWYYIPFFMAILKNSIFNLLPRCVGFIMAKLVLRELMDASVFRKFKSFLNKMLDRNWGAGWNLLSLLLATKPSARISCLDALRHPFLCGPKWRVRPSMDVIRWGLGSTAVRMAEDYIYGQHQVSEFLIYMLLRAFDLFFPHPCGIHVVKAGVKFWQSDAAISANETIFLSYLSGYL
ncbi:putative plastid-lipid-associated protein 14, chloroplastic [Cocos nucifera]|nr:putative plastid-lipid-associated protein 14, chloroplastic [Cocos nucifera]